MKKLILGIFTAVTCFSLNAQIIQMDGAGPDLAGTTVDITVDGNTTLPIEPKFHITNDTGSDQQWRFKRVRVNVPSNWTDNICWPPLCYLTQGAQTYFTPNTGTQPAPIIVAGEDTTTTGLKAELKPQYYPDGTSDSYAEFMYYLTDGPGNIVDSLGIRIFYFVGLEETLPTLDLSVSPNPAADYINVKSEGVSQATVKVVDILGNIVREEKVQGQKKIDVLDLNNGVYFVILESEGLKPVNKKIIVRH